MKVRSTFVVFCGRRSRFSIEKKIPTDVMPITVQNNFQIYHQIYYVIVKKKAAILHLLCEK